MSSEPILATVPACISTEIRVDGNAARQLLSPIIQAILELSGPRPHLKTSDGTSIQLVAGPSEVQPGSRALYIGREGIQRPLEALTQPGRARWIGDLSPARVDVVRTSWIDAITLSVPDRAGQRQGLRLPQLGAMYSLFGHWTTGSTQPATVVMPTGTGKTETMIAILVSLRPERLLVVVPSDALRTQTATKFESFGVLKALGVIGQRAAGPVVGQVRHAFTTLESARRFAHAANVIITTPQALFAADTPVTQALLDTCSHLFVDEAHHVEADTWRDIRDAFAGKPVVQFTATPFREDGRRMAGQIAYSFPLGQAQEQGYFSRIDYQSVVELTNPDEKIAAVAVDRLRQDLAAGFDHLLLARVNRIGRATEVQEIYARLAPDLGPVVLHSAIPVTSRRLALDAVASRESRIIVCVDMLGEGFDLPSLKVAAIHDPHKSLGITLQFIGRFARAAGGRIGDASVITCRPQGSFDEALRTLYSEDPDWNLIIRDLSEAAVGREREVGEFESAFQRLPDEVSLRNIEPKMSAVVFRTHCQEWNPSAVYDLFPESAFFTNPIAINDQHHVAWFVLETRSPVRWGELETIADVSYDFYALYWDETQQLLYINASNTEIDTENLAKAVCGDDVLRYTGEEVYRVMAHIKRLVPTNVGLLAIRNRSRRFSMHVGADVVEGFPIAEAQTRTKTNIFAYGYEGGTRVSIGASQKGRIWSYRIAPTLRHWVDWCNHVGGKVSDPTISINEVMQGFIRPRTVESRPEFVALALEWPWEVFLNTSDETRVASAHGEWPLVDVDLAITDFSATGPISFAVEAPDSVRAAYQISFAAGRMNYLAIGEEMAIVTRRTRIPLSQYFSEHGLTIHFEQDSTVVPPGILLKPDRDLLPFDLSKLEVVDWAGIDLRKESMGPNRDPDSIQARVLRHLRDTAQWEILIDDDGSGEIADIVAIRVEGNRLVVVLAHCKYSTEARPGARLDDLYEVCGQAQKSVRWRRNIDVLFRRVIQREQNRYKRHNRTGLLTGDGRLLYQLQERARLLKPDFSIMIAQPGLSKGAVSGQQLHLLASTEVYLHEVANASLAVVCSV